MFHVIIFDFSKRYKIAVMADYYEDKNSAEFIVSYDGKAEYLNKDKYAVRSIAAHVSGELSTRTFYPWELQ